MPYYQTPSPHKNVSIIIENKNFRENVRRVVDAYSKSIVDIIHQYPSTSGRCREVINKDCLLMRAPSSLLTYFILLDIKILIVCNDDQLSAPIDLGQGFNISIRD